jgi:signal transduction histidine kinase
LARLEVEGSPPAPVDPSPLAAVLQDAVRRFESAAVARRVTIDLDTPPPGLAVRIPPGVAGLVFGNLLDNAIKFSPPGSRVRVGVATEDGTAMIAVSDGGPGVPADELPRIFEPFYRGKTGAPTTLGTGLGLAICRTLLDRHGGAIAVESAAGQGATFRVQLPLAS